MNKNNKYNEVITLYKSGVQTNKEIAEKLNIQVATVGRHLDKARKNGEIPNKKNIYEQVIECYNSGITNYKEISKVIGKNEKTVATNLSRARKEKRIFTEKSYEQVVRLCNNTEKSLEEIAEQINLSLSSTRAYYAKARKNGEILKKVRGKAKGKIDKEEQTIKMSQEGISSKEIAQKLGISKYSVEKYLKRAIKKQLRQQEKEEYEAVLQLIKNDISSIKKIQEITRLSVERIKEIIKRVKTEEGIEIESNYEKVIKLYKSGTGDFKDIAEKLGVSENTVRSYIYKAKNEGRINQILSPKMRVVREFDMGNTSVKQVSKATGVSRTEVEEMLIKYEKEYQKQRQNLLSENIFVGKNAKKIQNKYNLNDETMSNLTKLLKKKYPYEVAQELHIQPKIIYDIIEGMSRTEKRRMIEGFLINNSVYKRVSAMRRQGIPVSEGIKQVQSKQKAAGMIEVAELYYVLEQDEEADKILNKIIYGENYSQAMKNIAMQKKSKIDIEVRNKKIRDCYKENLEKYGSAPSYENMCKNFRVRMSLIIELLGREEICL